MEQATQDMLVNLLASMGGALGGKGSWQEAGGNWAKGRIQSRNYASMLQKLLGGMPAGTEMKAGTGVDGKMTFTMPTSSITENQHLPGFSNDVGNVNPFVEPRPGSVGGIVSPTPAPTPTAPVSGGGFVNPSSSPLNISDMNLAGLTPENITAALQLREGQQRIGMAGEELGMRRSELAMKQEDRPLDQSLRAAQIKHLMAQATHLEKGETADQPFPIQIPGVGTVTNKQWAEIPTTDRSYAIYVHQAKQLGFDNTKIMSKREWEDYTPTDHIKMLKQLGADDKLMERELQLRQAGAPKIENIIERKKELNKLEGESYMTDPKNLTSDLAKHLNSEEAKQKVFEAESVSKNPDKKARAAENKKAGNVERFSQYAGFIENQIKAGGGEIVGTKYSPDYRTLIWTVKWPSGTTSTIKRDVPGIKEYLDTRVR